MKHLVPTILLAFLMGAASLSAQDLNRDSIPPANTMVAHPDEEPEYPGDYYALNNFIQKNLIYPAEAWRAGEREPGALRFIIRADGVACGLQPSGMHPTLYEEMKRVFSLMPRWIPAKKDGRPVNVDYTIPTAPIHLYDYWDTAMPYHVADAMKKIKRYTDESKDFRQGLNATEAEELREQAEDIVGFTPENVAVASPLARLLAAQGMHQEAIAVADSCTSRYKLMAAIDTDYEGYPEEFARLFRQMEKEGNYFRVGYDGRDNIHAALTYALVCDVSGNDTLTRQAYAQTLDVITDRMLLQDFRKPGKTYANDMYRQLMEEKIRLALSPRSLGNTLGRSDVNDVLETHTYGDAMRVIDRKVEEGKINNARIQQIDTQLKDMQKNHSFHANLGNKDVLNLYGLYALVLYLSEGMDAQQQYMDSLGRESAKLESYFNKMERKIGKHQAELTNREAVIRSLAFLAPINQADGTKDGQRQQAKDFYRYRDAVKDVYPLEWLWE